METRTYEVYSFEELTECQKGKVLVKYRYIMETIGENIYQRLKKSHYEYIADDSVIDTIEANDFMFTSAGEID